MNAPAIQSSYPYSAVQLPIWRRSALAAMSARVQYGVVAAQLERGPCIVTCNHVSLLDGIIVALASPRPLVFPVTPLYARDHPYASRLLRWCERRGLGRVVPMDKGHFLPLRHLCRALEDGESVCIFPEGGLADGFNPLPENPGYRWLHEKTGRPIVRARIRGAERSRFFAKNGDAFRPSILLEL